MTSSTAVRLRMLRGSGFGNPHHPIRSRPKCRGAQGRKALCVPGESCDASSMWTDERGSELLPLAECARLLALAAKEGLTGRLGISTPQAPIIQPVNFGYDDHRVVVCLGPGHMLDSISGALVAFEVDQVDRDALQAWSVLVRGLATPLEAPESQVIAKVAPTPVVPSPGDMLFVIRSDVVTGRRFTLDKTTPDADISPSSAAHPLPR